MSYSPADDDFTHSPKNEYMRSRSSIGVNLWSSSSSNSEENKFWCDVCKVRLIPKENTLFCKSCGQYTNISDYSKEKKLKPRYPSASTVNNQSVVISKDIKKKRKDNGEYANAHLSEEERNELRDMGLNV